MGMGFGRRIKANPVANNLVSVQRAPVGDEERLGISVGTGYLRTALCKCFYAR